MNYLTCLRLCKNFISIRASLLNAWQHVCVSRVFGKDNIRGRPVSQLVRHVKESSLLNGDQWVPSIYQNLLHMCKKGNKFSKPGKRELINCKGYALRSDKFNNWIVFCAVSAISQPFIKIKLLQKLQNFIDISLCKKVCVDCTLLRSTCVRVNFVWTLSLHMLHHDFDQ